MFWETQGLGETPRDFGDGWRLPGETKVRNLFFLLTSLVRAAHQPGVVIPGIVFSGSLETPPGLVDALVSLVQ